MNTAAIVSILIALSQLEPAFVAFFNVARMAQDITDAQLIELQEHAHKDVRALGDAIAAAKGN